MNEVSWLWVSFFGCVAVCFASGFAASAYKAGEHTKRKAAQDALVLACVEAGRDTEECREAFADSEFTECINTLDGTPERCADALEGN